MVYHCTLPTEGCASVCDCPLLPLRHGTAGQLDVVDEALAFFRANVLFRSFDIASSADKLLLYLTLYIGHILQRECILLTLKRVSCRLLAYLYRLSVVAAGWAMGWAGQLVITVGAPNAAAACRVGGGTGKQGTGGAAGVCTGA